MKIEVCPQFFIFLWIGTVDFRGAGGEPPRRQSAFHFNPQEAHEFLL
ncbi:hypothetical protein SD77_3346 [Bacillus badius]|uniref:Ribose 5-phosphate isomerase B n=1 Tax=Bacillus badius TaxID=1455 RepID=A0ABR5AXK9_BACBA|nr:hypothetical protein SD78_0062 [Bacillus badius]KIL79480.1 hypothetical protein SD77_3346 [Bacillus badius]